MALIRPIIDLTLSDVSDTFFPINDRCHLVVRAPAKALESAAIQPPDAVPISEYYV